MKMPPNPEPKWTPLPTPRGFRSGSELNTPPPPSVAHCASDSMGCDAGPPTPPSLPHALPFAQPPEMDRPSFSLTAPLDGANPTLLPDLLVALGADPATQRTETRLLEHPFVTDMESAAADPRAMLRAFAREQATVVDSDTRSLKAGLELMQKTGARPAAAEFFRFCLFGEQLAAKELEKLLSFCGEEAEAGHERRAAVLRRWSPHPRCQSYPSYFCRLIQHSQPAAVAVAFCVNFPAWGAMCGRIRAAARARPPQGACAPPTEEDLGFLTHFTLPIDNLRDMAQKVLEENLAAVPGLSYKEIRDAVVLLQHGEVEFWDGLMDVMAQEAAGPCQ